MWVDAGRGRAIANSVSSETPSQRMSNLDHVVTQWMAPSYAPCGSAWISSHDHVVGASTSPSIVKVQVPTSSFGVASAVSTGQDRPVSYWPGGRRASRGRPRPVNPRVKRPIETFYFV